MKSANKTKTRASWVSVLLFKNPLWAFIYTRLCNSTSKYTIGSFFPSNYRPWGPGSHSSQNGQNLDPNLHHEQNQEGITKVKPNTCSNGHSFSQNASHFFLFFFFFLLVGLWYPLGTRQVSQEQKIEKELHRYLLCVKPSAVDPNSDKANSPGLYPT